MKKKSVTIDIVSEKANVSKTTISRYLNGKFQHMSEETKQRIKGIIEELEYRPNVIAQNLKSKKTGLIGVIVSDITNPFVSILIKGIIDVCTEEGYQVITASSDEKIEKEIDYIRSMVDRQVEGLIINTTGDNESFLKDLKEKNINMILADRPMQQCILDTVTTNNYEMTTKAVQVLYKEGFDKVGFFSNQLSNSNVRLVRHNAFLEESKKYISNPEKLVYILANNKEDNLEYKQALLDLMSKNKNKKIAVFAVNGVTMLNLLNACKDLNITIPNNLGVCGFDDLAWSTLIGSGISVVSQPSYEVGVRSAEILIGRIRNEIYQSSPIYVELASKLILRGSTNLNLK